MNKGSTSFKEEAHQALSRREWRKALESFQKHCAEETGDIRSRLKIAELLERLGQKKEAIQVYREVAEAYAQDGFLLQAISINKIMLRIDPSLKEVSERLTQLNIEKSRESKPLQPLPHIPLFSELNKQELHYLLSRVLTKTFPKGVSLFREGETGESLMIINQGEVEIAKQNYEGKEIVVHHLRAGDLFGEIGLFTDQQRHANARTLTECEVFEIEQKELYEIMKTHPRMGGVLYNLFKQQASNLFIMLSPLFSSLTSAERKEVIQRFRLLRVPGETILFQKGDFPTSLYMIKSGEVEISTLNYQGQKVVLEIQKGGNFFGEVSLFLDQPRMTFAKTTQPSELLKLTQKDFKACLAQCPRLQSTIKEISSKRLTRIKEIFSQERVDKVKEAIL